MVHGRAARHDGIATGIFVRGSLYPGMSTSAGISIARPKRPPCVLICAKCVKKVDHGRAIQKAVKAGLADRASATGRRPGKLVQTKCMGVCPRQGVTLASAATLGRGELLIVKRGADVPTVLDILCETAAARS